MKRLFYSLIFISFLSVSESSAQQLSLSNHYIFNPYFYNPAFAGADGQVSTFLGVKKQWAGIKNAPTLQYASINSPVADKMALGGVISIDQSDILERFYGKLSFSYLVQINDDQKLTFGIEGQVQQNRVNFSGIDVDDWSDKVLLTGSDLNGTGFDANFGVRYNFKDLEIGVSIPQLLENDIVLGTESNNTISTVNRRHFLGTASYNLSVMEDKIALKPLIMARYTDNTPFSWDVGVTATYDKMVSLTTLYREQSGLVAAVAYNFENGIKVGYAYEMAAGSLISTHTSGGHEVFVGVKFGKNKAEESKLEEAVEEQRLMLQSQIDSLAGELESNQEKTKKQLADKETRIAVLEDQIKNLKEGSSNNQDSTNPNASNDQTGETSNENANNSSDSQSSDNSSTNGQNKERVIEDGSTPDELKIVKSSKPSTTVGTLEKGYYVVVESFKQVENAEKKLNILKGKGYEALVVYNATKDWYYVYLERFENLPSALKEMENVRASGFNDAWVHIYK